MTTPQVQVGTGIIVVKNNKVLAGIRLGSHAAGLISFPGGHLDFGETWDHCVYRELEEECGPNFKVRVRPYSKNRLEFFVTNDIMPEYNKHYITIFLVADWLEGEPENCEPHKCQGWKWLSYEDLQQYVKDSKAAQWIPSDLLTSYRGRIGI